MITAKHTYRGVGYQPADHEQASAATFEHVYRGKRYQASLKHEARPQDSDVQLRYRGKVYQHRKAEASQ